MKENIPYPVNEYRCEECNHRDSEHNMDGKGECLICDCGGLC